jgi:hypothetical protein
MHRKGFCRRWYIIYCPQGISPCSPGQDFLYAAFSVKLEDSDHGAIRNVEFSRYTYCTNPLKYFMLTATPLRTSSTRECSIEEEFKSWQSSLQLRTRYEYIYLGWYERTYVRGSGTPYLRGTVTGMGNHSKPKTRAGTR